MGNVISRLIRPYLPMEPLSPPFDRGVSLSVKPPLDSLLPSKQAHHRFYPVSCPTQPIPIPAPRNKSDESSLDGYRLTPSPTISHSPVTRFGWDNTGLVDKILGNTK